MWVVVLFQKENSLAVIPKCWLMFDNDKCYWPPVPDVSNYVCKCKEPDGNWHVFGVRVLNNGKVYDNYLKARAAARAAENTSDINTESEDQKKRKRKPKKIYSDSSSEDDDISVYSKAAFPPLPNAPTRFASCSSSEPRSAISQSSSELNKNDISSSVSKETLTDVSPSTSQSQRLIEKTSDDFLHRLRHQLSVMNFKINNIQSDMTTIIDLLRKTQEVNSGQSDFNYEPLPLQTLQSLNEFEDYLQIEDNFKKFTLFVQKIGGSSIYECVKRVLRRVMVDELATKFSWNGKRQKRAFEGLNIQKGLTSGIQANVTTKNCSEKDVEASIKSWLRHAKSRIKI
ncbi:uncharacterized protein LOC135136186 [Zophobas morio]|uniref:uncharacterized protein LOC135133165 n=1 Tax=Zophobas morio TaxID=2755281 RepID=UPI003083A105